MSTTVYVSLLDHEKYYGTVENIIIPTLKSKRTVFTNISMRTENCERDFKQTVIQFEMKDL